MSKRYRLTLEEAAILAPILQAMPVEQQLAYIKNLRRLEAGADPHDSAVEMLMELGATKAEAHASLDRTMASVRH